MKKFVLTSVALSVLLGAFAAQAKWVSQAKVSRVRVYAAEAEYRMDIWFDTEVASGCSNNSRVAVRTTDPDVLHHIRQTAITAKLSGRDVEVNTDGCESGYGKLDYLSLK